MKKLFTLVLTLAMVFAIAAPAMAAWGTPGSSASGAPFTVEVTAVIPSTDSFGNSYYNPYNTSNVVVPGAPLYVMITLNVPSKAKLKAQYGKDDGSFSSDMVLSNLVLLQVVNDGNGFVSKASGSIISGNVEGSSDNNKTITYTAVLLVTAQSALPAKLTYSVSYDSNIGDVAKGITVGSINVKLVGKDTTITSGSNTITFTLNDKFIVPPTWTMTIGSSGAYPGTYTVFAGNGSPAFVLGGKVFQKGVAEDAAQYNALEAAYNLFTKDLGFGVGETVYFTEANISANYGLSNSKTASVAYSNVGTAPVITPTPTVPGAPGTGGSINVPNTGDSVSVVGYMMIGLALLATAAVIVRKVRA